jgi:hypothetical protein
LSIVGQSDEVIKTETFGCCGCIPSWVVTCFCLLLGKENQQPVWLGRCPAHCIIECMTLLHICLYLLCLWLHMLAKRVPTVQKGTIKYKKHYTSWLRSICNVKHLYKKHYTPMVLFTRLSIVSALAL